jgi:hypothetical protein
MFDYVTSGRLAGGDGPDPTGAQTVMSSGLRRLLAAGTEAAAEDRPSMADVLDAMVEECRLGGVDVIPVVLPPDSAPTMVTGAESVTIISELPTVEPVARPRRRRAVTIVALVSVIVLVTLLVWAPWHGRGGTGAGAGSPIRQASAGPTTSPSTTVDLSVPEGVVDVSAELQPKVAAALPSAGGPFPYDVMATEASYFPASSDFPRLAALPARAVWSFVNTHKVGDCTRQISALTMTGFAGHVRVVGDRTSVEVAAVQLLTPNEAHMFFTGRSLSLGVDGADCVSGRGAITKIVHRDLTPAFSTPVDEYNCWRFEGPTRQTDQLEQVAYACSARRGALEAEVRVGSFVETPTSQNDATAIITQAIDAMVS